MAKDTRRRIRKMVQEYPGLHQRELARQLGFRLARIQYHLPAMVEEGELEVRVQDGLHRIYPTDSREEPDALAALRDPKRLQIVLLLLDKGPLPHAHIVRRTGFGKSTLSFHLRRLERDGIVRQVEHDFAVAEPKKIRALLERHPPTPDLVDKFTRVWGDLYGRD